MIAASILFTLPPDTDWEALRATARDRAETLYPGVPGLQSKAFVLDRESRRYGGLYVWESQAVLDAFLASEIFAGAKARFGEPEIQTFEVAAYLQEGAVLAPSVR